MICPNCKIENTDDWPITVNEVIVEGGCQEYWENECSKGYWKEMKRIYEYLGRK